MPAARPELVTIETAWRAPKDQRPGALSRHQYRELDIPDNPDAEPPCNHAKAAIICSVNMPDIHSPSVLNRIAPCTTRAKLPGLSIGL
jgi:ParB family chromosome partitioning protein